MKKIYFLSMLLVTSIGFAQIPTDYYATAVGTQYVLKDQLKKIINDSNDGLPTEYLATDLGYSALYATFVNSDKDFYYENNGTILDMYSEKPGGTDSYEYTYGSSQQDDGTMGTAEGQRFNREHIIPQSVFSSANPMKSDAHFVVPSDKYVNAQRGNNPFGVVQTATLTTTNGSKKGNNLNSGYSSGYTATVFEPIDEFKGDIARMYFYFVTRYEDNMTGYSYDMFDGTSDKCFNDTFLSILYTWHVQDPVSIREIDRNNAIHDRQNNRNPFIDNPQFVYEIWQTSLSVEEVAFSLENITISPNPTTTNSITFSTTENIDIEIYDLLGKKIIESKVSPINNKVNIQSLNKGMYIVRIQSENGNSIAKKIIRN